ncbi:MAG: SpoIID/LytB domain-containing protein [bacterium]|nr:SpoIID/LytB domain-containing protein [bacterium]
MGEELPSKRWRGRVFRARRAAWVGLTVAVLIGGGPLGCAAARAGGPTEVRVLIYDGTDPIAIGARELNTEVALSGEALVVDGREVGNRWSPRGAGPWKVGSRKLRGQIVLRAEAGRIQVLNRVDLEDYVTSTVGGEMSPNWPREALRAQAVAARTYVLHEAAKRRASGWDVRATAASQVYRGIAAESDETRSAARSTRGEVLTYRGEPILAVFHSTAGGRTATAGEVWGQDLPYLRVLEVEEEDEAPHTYWRTLFSAEDLSEVLAAASVDVGSLGGVSVTRRSHSGRVERIEVRGTTQIVELRGSRLKGFVGSLGLRSTLFDIRRTAQGYAFVGSGFGHGVGMSQWGARALAERGSSYQRILARFYPGTRLENWSSRRIAVPAISFGGSPEGATGGQVR